MCRAAGNATFIDVSGTDEMQRLETTRGVRTTRAEPGRSGSTGAARLLVSVRRVLLFVVFALFVIPGTAGADTTVSLFDSFAGNVNFIGTQQTLRTQPDGGNSCAVTAAATNATLAGLPAGATVEAAYLYWAGSGNTPDYNVTFDGSALAADPARRYTATFTLGVDYDYFSGVADVTSVVAAKGNGTYSFAGLTVDNGDPWCASSAVLAGWALLVIYSDPSEDFRVINVYEGFQHFRGSAITLNPSNFLVPVSPINGRNAHLTWEGDVGNSAPMNGFNEALTFDGTALTDANNPVNNQFNSVSTMSTPVDTTSYGVDFDVFDISAYLAAGQTSATTVYSSGGDLVLLSSQVISTTNTPVSDLGITKVRNGALTPGQNANYTLTVTNNGPISEPGQITVTDTLPAQLSYVSTTGTGWSCGAVGQTVTCTRAGSLASGVSAAVITLTVAVAAGASGVITNTATVDGQNFDNVPGNDTATDTYTLLPAAYAYYAMDETSWGAVVDSSGNGRDGTASGSAAPTDYPPPSPPGSAIVGSPGTCGAGSIPAAAGSGVDTGIDINSLGNAGTIAFWYSSNTAWNDGNDRMLLDASNDLGNNPNQDKHFYVVKGDGGEIRFGLEDDDDDNEMVSTGQNSFPANEWHHIAITWEWGGSNRMRVYLDGVEEDDTGINDNIGNYAALYLGMTHGGIGGTGTDFTTNTANGYLDEVRIFSGALAQADIQAVMAATHSCVPVDHYEITYPSGATAVTCESLNVRITAHNASHTAVVVPAGTAMTLNTTTATGVWLSPTVTGSGTWTPSGTNNGQAGYTWPGGESVLEVRLRHNTPLASIGIDLGGTYAEAAAEDPAAVFVDAAFRVTDAAGLASVAIGTQIAGKNSDTGAGAQTLFLQAIRTDTATGSCVGALQSQTATVQLASECNNPGTCVPAPGSQVSVRNSTPAMQTIAQNNNGAVAAYSNVSLAFDAQSKAPLVLNYPDAGQITLHARYALPSPPATNMIGTSNAFVVKPAGFVISNIVRTSDSFANPAAPDASGARFIGAGENFTATVTAVGNDGVTATPNFGRETAPEGVLLSRTLIAPVGGTSGTLANASVPGTEFGAGGMVNDPNGSASVTNLGWNEVGIIQLTGQIADNDYLGGGTVPNLYASANIGRFTPSYFDITRAHGCPAAGFTYGGVLPAVAGQAFSVTATARTVLGAVTLNYHSAFGFAKDTTISNAGDATGFAANVLAGANAFSNGVGTNNAINYRFASKATAPVTLTLRGVDADAISSSGHTEETTIARSGRISIQNAFGSELVDLAMPMRMQYYESAANGWVLHNADTCTATTLGLSNYLGNLAAGETCVQDTGSPGLSGVGCAVAGPASERFLESPALGFSGDFNLYLRAAGGGNDGSVDVAADLSVQPWLQFDWDGDGLHDNNPTGRATFGIFRGSPRQIYLRERY